MFKEGFMKGIRKVLCSGLVFCLLLGLTACGKQKEAETASGWGEDNAALAKEFVYGEQILKMPEYLRNASVMQTAKIDSNIYAVWEIYGDEDMPESCFKLMQISEDGSDIKFLDMQNKMPDISEEKDRYAGFAEFTFSGDRIYGVKEYFSIADAETMGGAEAIKTALCCWDFNGNMIWEQVLSLVDENEMRWHVRRILPNDNSGVNVIFSGDDTEIQAVTSAGEFQEKKSLTAIDSSLEDFSDLIICKDGTLQYTYVDEKKGSAMWLNKLDLSQFIAGEAKQLPDDFMLQGHVSIADGESMADVVYTTTNGVYSVNMGETKTNQIMSFVNSDVPTTNMNHIVILDETRFLGFYYDNHKYSQVVSIFTKKNPEDIKDRTVLVLAGYYIPSEVKNRVVQFNKTNPEYRIVMEEYHTYDTTEDGMAGYNRLNMDILENGLPDILIADSYFTVSSYISKGLIADIDTLIREDEELSQTEFLENVFDAYRIEGKLYHITPAFSVKTLIGKESVVGNRTSWTMKEMQELMVSMPEGTQSIGELTRRDFIQMMIQYCGNEFIDAKDRKCDFDNENFVAMLEYAKSLPEEINWGEMGDDYWINQDSQYRENRTILAKCDVSDTRYVNDYINGYFGEEISYIGFPSDTGNGAVVEASEQYLLSAKSEHLEGAWEFVRYYLTEEYQREVIGFPVNKMIFEERAMEAAKPPYTIDRNGNKQEYEYKMSIGGVSVVLPNMTTEQVEEFIKFVESIDKSAYHDEDIEAIINEEVASFFTGQKSASEVAKVIQSRVEIYVNEIR